MGGFMYGGCQPLKVDDAKKKVLKNGEMGTTNYPFQEPKVFLQGYGEKCIPQTCSSWNGDGVVLVRDNIVIEYMQLDFVEGLMRTQNGDVAWRSMCHIFADEGAVGELLDEYRSAQRYIVTEYDLKTLTTKKYKVVLDESAEFDELDFYRLGEFLGGTIIDKHYVVNDGVLKQCIGKIDDLVIPDSVIKIDESLFCDYQLFNNIFIPKKLVDIPDSFFVHCRAECISVANDNPKYYVENGCLIDRYTKTLIWGYGECMIPCDGSVTKLAHNAFSNFRGEKCFVIPDAINEIESGAFRWCDWLEELHIPDTFADRLEDIFGKKFVKEGEIWKVVKEERNFHDFSF